MGIFSKIFKKKERKFGSQSNIAKLRSPYLKKMPLPERALNRNKKPMTLIPSAKIKSNSNKGKVILAIILSIGIGIFAVYSIAFSDLFLINNFKVMEEGTIVDNIDTINQILRKQLGKNIFFIDQEAIIQEIKSAHPEIEKIQISKKLPKTIKVEFEKFPTTANIVDIINGVQKKYLVDSQGFITEENNENPDLPYIRIATKEPLKTHTPFIEPADKAAEKLNFITKATNLFEEKFGMRVLYAQYKQREREVYLYTEKSFYVMIDMEKDLAKQIEKLKKALVKLDIYNQPLVYIDLRISGTDNEKVIFLPRPK